MFGSFVSAKRWAIDCIKGAAAFRRNNLQRAVVCNRLLDPSLVSLAQNNVYLHCCLINIGVRKQVRSAEDIISIQLSEAKPFPTECPQHYFC